MQIKSIAVFHNTSQVGSAWGCAEGLSYGLRTLGYQVHDCGNPLRTPPDLELLRRVDGILMGAPEWFYTALREKLGSEWDNLPAVKASWYAESAYRDDQNFPFADMQNFSDLHYFPAVQDAREFGGIWLPFGADTYIFRPLDVQKAYGAAFVGSLYPKRQEFLEQFGSLIQVVPQVGHGEIGAPPESLVEAYNSIEIFVNMPSYSRLLVTKVFEVMACGVAMVTPRIDHPSGAENMETFEHGVHLYYYDPASPDSLAEIIQTLMNDPERRAAVAAAGMTEVRRRHTLEQRLIKIVSDMEAFSA